MTSRYTPTTSTDFMIPEIQMPESSKNMNQDQIKQRKNSLKSQPEKSDVTAWEGKEGQSGSKWKTKEQEKAKLRSRHNSDQLRSEDTKDDLKEGKEDASYSQTSNLDLTPSSSADQDCFNEEMIEKKVSKGSMSRAERRLLQNRQSALKCRLKKKEQFDKMYTIMNRLKTEQETLNSQFKNVSQLYQQKQLENQVLVSKLDGLQNRQTMLLIQVMQHTLVQQQLQQSSSNKTSAFTSPSSNAFQKLVQSLSQTTSPSKQAPIRLDQGINGEEAKFEKNRSSSFLMKPQLQISSVPSKDLRI